jgi:hypothetical protein
MQTHTDATDDAQRTPPTMTRRRFNAVAVAALLGAVGIGAARGGATSAAGAATTTTAGAATAATAGKAATKRTIASTATAAKAFMKTLSAEQRKQLVYDYEDETKTTKWSNFPVTFVARAGVNLNDLTAKQQAAAALSLSQPAVSQLADPGRQLRRHDARHRRRTSPPRSSQLRALDPEERPHKLAEHLIAFDRAARARTATTPA